MGQNFLIIYYSWSGNTDTIARLIQKKTGGQLFELNPIQAYPHNYGICVKQAKTEIREKFMPELEIIPDTLEDYDVILIGSPIWWHTMAPPIFTFLSQADLSGKTVIPFCTHGGGGEGHYPNDVASLCQNSNVLNYLSLYGNGGKSAEEDILAWLKQIGI